MPESLSPEIRQAVIQAIAKMTREKYVYPHLGEEIAEHIEMSLAKGTYDPISDGDELALKLTSDLRGVSNDQHWMVRYHPQDVSDPSLSDAEADEAHKARWLESARRSNFGFEKVERLKGNIGYIDLRRFAPSEYAGETAVAAMNFVANCDALIFDLRQNIGGSPTMVQLLTSYLLEPEPKHINTFYIRARDEYQQFWTFPHVPGKRMPDIPVYVITSHATGSGAEEFTYNLKHMERATIIGEKSVGAAHPVTIEIVQRHFRVHLPHGRPINPITQENWEVKGVEPHIAVPQEQAPAWAHIHALETLLANCPDEEQKRDLEWDYETVKSQYMEVDVDKTILSRYVGTYGERVFGVKEGSLTYEHSRYSVTWKLEPISETRFCLNDDMKFDFVLDEQEAAAAVMIMYRDGRPKIRVARSG